MKNNQKNNEGREQEIRNLRIGKIERLKEFGMESYPNPSKAKPSITLKEIFKNFSNFKKINSKKKFKIVGRILVKRGAGKIAFAKIFDGTGEFQVVLQADILGIKKMKVFDKLFDMGDFVIFNGTLFKTKKGEKSLLVKNFSMVGKTLLPLPEKFYGLQNQEEKYRKRYLDTLSNKDSFERFKIRAKIISEIRKFLDNENFLEVETPILQNQASGAMAETFKTHHNNYDLDMVLRISLEAEHKMIMAGGYPAIYEIGKNFRNEGSDTTHIQEFTMIEWYKAFEGLDYNLKLTEKMLKNIVKKVIGKNIFKIENTDGKVIKVDFGKKWKKLKFNDLIKKYAKVNPEKITKKELEKKAIKLGENKTEVKKMSFANLLDSVWKKAVKKNIINPIWVTHYPGGLKPLAIQNENGTSETAQLILAGFELSNHYAELVNPIKQRELLEKQVKAKKDGDTEAMEMNQEFLEAMEYGMPPMTGTGIGIDRLIGFLTEQNNLRDTIFFPIVKPVNLDKKIKKK